MLATIASINKFHEDAGIKEVNLLRNQSGWTVCSPALFASPLAEPVELLYYGWGKRCCDPLYLKS